MCPRHADKSTTNTPIQTSNSWDTPEINHQKHPTNRTILLRKTPNISRKTLIIPRKSYYSIRALIIPNHPCTHLYNPLLFQQINSYMNTLFLIIPNVTNHHQHIGFEKRLLFQTNSMKENANWGMQYITTTILHKQAENKTRNIQK